MLKAKTPALNPDAGATCDASVLALLRCPVCGQSLARSAHGQVACSACAASVQVHNGILDFVAGTASTQLDQIDYDRFYAIDENHARMTYDDIRTTAGRLWPADLGDALEIGCGTGGFSMAMLTRMPASRVVLTDVSLKMLAICRDRLGRMTGLRPRSVNYATYSGTQDCFRPGAFDTCFGTAVVHHVLDVPLFLRQVHRLLKPSGAAFFMEPNLRFHQALTETLAEILAAWLREDTVPQADISPMLNWMAEVHCNVVNTGDLDVLADREDKHLFTGEGFEAMAREAGFASAEALACNPDPDGLRTIGAYLDQIGVGRETLTRLRSAWPSAAATRFGVLAPRDSAPSYVFWLKSGGRRQTAPARNRAVTGGLLAKDSPKEPPVRLWLALALEQAERGLELVLDGWCLAPFPVRAVQVAVTGRRRRMPVWLPRPDVHAAINADGAYPPLHSLCSGTRGRIALEPADDGSAEVCVEIVAADGTVLPRGRVRLEPGGPQLLLQ